MRFVSGQEAFGQYFVADIEEAKAISILSACNEKDIAGRNRHAAEMLFCPNGAESFSPALTDKIGLRWVVPGTENNSERVGSGWERDLIQLLQSWENFGFEPGVAAARQRRAE